MNTKLENSALIVVDLQNGFMNEYTKSLPDKIKDLIGHVNFPFKIFTQFANKENSLYRNLIKWNGMTKDNEIEIVHQMNNVPDIIFKKYIYTVINKYFIDYVNNNNIKQFYIVGTDTDICVTKIAVDLFELGLVPFVLSEYCMSNAGNEFHDSALKILPRYIGASQIIRNAREYFGELWSNNL